MERDKTKAAEEKATPEIPRIRAKAYMDKFINPPDYMEEQKKKMERERDQRQQPDRLQAEVDPVQDPRVHLQLHRQHRRGRDPRQVHHAVDRPQAEGMLTVPAATALTRLGSKVGPNAGPVVR